ncbi:MAG: GNAT family N-acetyltransferase [Litoreibacter sp.]|nr:GNAT family N-acetyltransferase [Litoreibacter sp.]
MTVTRATTEDDLATCLTIRRVVFIEGQDVPEEEEVDGKDPDCLHYIMRKDGRAIATARVLPMEEKAKIQRVAVLEDARSSGIGSILMRAILDDLRSNHPFQKAILGSQTHAIGFYEKLGFTAYGPVYDDAGIPHRDMELTL